MADGVFPHWQSEGTRGIHQPRPDPIASSPRHPCYLPPHARKHFFPPTPPSTGNKTGPQTATHPVRPIPIPPATPALATPLGPVTPSRGRFTKPTTRVKPCLGLIKAYTPPSRSLKITELCGGLATSFEVFLKEGYAVASYTCADTGPDAHTAFSYRLARLSSRYPHLLPSEAAHG
jgi:hypothetical protein